MTISSLTCTQPSVLEETKDFQAQGVLPDLGTSQGLSCLFYHPAHHAEYGFFLRESRRQSAPGAMLPALRRVLWEGTAKHLVQTGLW